MSLPFETDDGIGHRATLGLIVLQADETIEAEFSTLATLDGVALHHSRIPSDPDVTLETLARMEAEIPAATRLLPAAANIDVIGYACTSGATIIGEATVAAAIQSVRPEATATDPLTSVKAAFRALSVTRIGFLTPYLPDVSAAMRDNLEAAGLHIAAFGSFEQSDEHTVAQIAPASVRDAIISIGKAPDCEAVFVSCTNLRTVGILEEAEKALSKPVVSSNQALAWHMLRLAGIADRLDGLGVLYQHTLKNC
ncbi:MAG: Asp/Glu racemase [Alphaproteobacteria bacterium]|nr:Asp/Glu racemase [Alphaproteobacteria bacterium]